MYICNSNIPKLEEYTINYLQNTNRWVIYLEIISLRYIDEYLPDLIHQMSGLMTITVRY